MYVCMCECVCVCWRGGEGVGGITSDGVARL